MLDAEAALAGAQADAGDIPLAAAGSDRRGLRRRPLRRRRRVDEAALGGNPVIPLLPRLQAIVGPERRRLRPPRRHEPGHRRRRRPRVVVRRCAERRQQPAAPRRRTVAVDLERTARGVADDRPHARPARRADDVRHRHRPVVRRPGRGVGRRLDRTARQPVVARRPERRRRVVRRRTRGRSPRRFAAAARARRRRRLAPRPARRRSPTSPARGAWPRRRCAKVALDVVLLAQDDVGEVAERADGRRRLVVDAAQAQPDRRHLGARRGDAGARARRHAAARRRQRRGRAGGRRVARRVAGARRAAAGDRLGGPLGAASRCAGWTSTRRGWPPTSPERRSGEERR